MVEDLEQNENTFLGRLTDAEWETLDLLAGLLEVLIYSFGIHLADL